MKRFAGAGAAAVNDLSLDIRDRELMVLLGPSGCGKTTALRMIAGLEHPDSGEIRIGGRRVNEVEPKDRDVALVFQSYALYPHMTVHENMLYPLKVRRMSRAEREQRVQQAAELLRITNLLGRKPRQLSGGELVAQGGWRFPAPHGAPLDGPLTLGIRPEDIALSLKPDAGGFPAPVFVSEPLVNEVIVNVLVGESVVKVRADPSVRPKRDERVYLKADPDRLHVFGGNGRRLNT